MSEKSKYVDAEIEMIRYDNLDIITTSGGENESQGSPDDWGWTT